MKLRVRGQSIRLRLTQREVDTFADAGYVEEAVQLGRSDDQRLVYALQRDARRKHVGVHYSGGNIIILVPAALADEWVGTNRVGFDGEQRVQDGSLAILVEKDFKCLTPRDEDESDAFPNPNQQHAC